MADVIGEMTVRIVGDNSQLNSSMKDSEKKAKKFGSSMGKLFTGVGFALAVAGIAKVSKSLILASSNAQETRNKFNVVFKDISKEANASAENLSKSFGLSATAAQSLLADTGDLLTGFGFSGEAALDLSTQVNELAVDLASFTNFSGGAEGASQALTKALLGERESVKALGISILDADVKAKVLELTQQGLTFETERQAKAYATMQIALEQSKNSLGDFERSESSFANQTRITKARIEDLQVALGDQLLPVANVGVGLFNDFLSSTIELTEGIANFATSAEGVEKISETFGTVAGILTVVKDVSKEFFDSFVTLVEDTTDPLDDLDVGLEGVSSGFSIIGTLLQLITGAFAIFGKQINGAVTSIVNLANIIKDTGAVIGDFFGLITGKTSVADFKETVGELKDSFVDLGKGIVEGQVNLFKELGNQVVNFGDQSKEVAEGLQESFEEASDKVKKRVKEDLENAGEGAESFAETTEEAAARSADAWDTMHEKLERNRADLTENAELVGKLNNTWFDALDEMEGKWDSYAGSVLGSASSLFSELANLQDAEAEKQTALIDRQLESQLNALGADFLASEEGIKKKEELEKAAANKKAQVEYDAALGSWNLKLLAGIASGAQSILTTMANVPFPFNIPLAIAQGAISGVQLGIIGANKPVLQKFADGGIVAGASFAGDQVPTMQNSGEMDITRAQQAGLWDFIRNGSQGTTNNNTSTTINNNSMFSMGNEAGLRQAARALFPFSEDEARRRGTSLV
jgi:hypothetical protein